MLLDVLNQLVLIELMPGKIHRHADGIEAFIQPLFDLMAGGFEDPVADGKDQPVFLGGGNEFQRRNPAFFRMGPAQQAFQARKLAGGQRKLGLIV